MFKKPLRTLVGSRISCRVRSPHGHHVRAAFTGLWDAITPTEHVNESPYGHSAKADLWSLGAIIACGLLASPTRHVIRSPRGSYARTGSQGFRGAQSPHGHLDRTALTDIGAVASPTFHVDRSPYGLPESGERRYSRNLYFVGYVVVSPRASNLPHRSLLWKRAASGRCPLAQNSCLV